jgi:hypothetical protein
LFRQRNCFSFSQNPTQSNWKYKVFFLPDHAGTHFGPSVGLFSITDVVAAARGRRNFGILSGFPARKRAVSHHDNVMEARMHDHVSERFYDHERVETYLDLIQSSLDRPQGAEQAWLLDRLASTTPASTSRTVSVRPRLALRWFALPRLPLPFLTWA